MANQINSGIALSLFAALVGGVGYIAKSTHETGVNIEHRLTQSEANNTHIVRSLESISTVVPKVSELKIEMSIMKSSIKDINQKIGNGKPKEHDEEWFNAFKKAYEAENK